MPKIFTIIILRLTLTLGQRILREAHIWSKPQHGHILPFLSITTNFYLTVSIVIPWMSSGHGTRFRSRSASLEAPWNNWWLYKVICLDPVKDRTRTMLPAQSLLRVSSLWVWKVFIFVLSQRRFRLILFYVNVVIRASALWGFWWLVFSKIYSCCSSEELHW